MNLNPRSSTSRLPSRPARRWRASPRSRRKSSDRLFGRSPAARAVRQERARRLQMAASESNAAGLEVAGKKYKLGNRCADDKYNPSETAITPRAMVQEHKTPQSGAHSVAFRAATNKRRRNTWCWPTPACRKVTARAKAVAAHSRRFTRTSSLRQARDGQVRQEVAIANADHDYAKAGLRR